MSNIYDRVLITGGGGMLAQAVIRALSSRGVRAEAPSRRELDITRIEVGDAFMRFKPTLVINCAAYTKVDLAEQEEAAANDVNHRAVVILGFECSINKAKLVHFSTDFVFDGVSTRPYQPSDSPNPSSAYGRSKREGEVALTCVKEADHLVIRTSWLYGPGGPNFVQTMLKVARAGKPLKVVNDQVGSPTFTHDLADATLALIDHDARGIYHATNSGQMTWFDFARAIFEEFDVQADLSPTTSAEWKAQYPNSAPRPAYSVLDCSETERVIGRPMPDWRDGLRRYRELVEPRPS